MTARASTPDPKDYLFPIGEPVLKVLVRCHCGIRAVDGPFFMAKAFVQKVLRQERILPADTAGSTRCSRCKATVKVTAGALHLA